MLMVGDYVEVIGGIYDGRRGDVIKLGELDDNEDRLVMVKFEDPAVNSLIFNDYELELL